MSKMHYQPENLSEQEKRRYKNFLAEDEELVLATGFGQIYLRQKFIIYLMFPGGIFWILGAALAYFEHFNVGYGLLIGMVFSAFFAFAKTWFMNRANRYLLTTRRVIKKGGFFAVKLTSALYDKITHIEVDQGFIDRYFMHHGTIVVNTAGANKDEIILKYIDYPIEFKNILERLINREREQFGRQTGPVVSLEGELVE